MKTIIINPKTKKSERITYTHGRIMRLISKGTINKEPAYLVQSLGNDQNDTWMGWLTDTDIDIEEL